MPNQSDAQLLRDYAAHGAESAFAEIVARHTGLIYSAALRQSGSPELAREIAQNVLTDLARKSRTLAPQLTDNASLVGWLYRATRYAALTLLRDERRREVHQRLVMENFHPSSDPSTDWTRVAPVLDEAMAALNDTDREAVLLRYFQNHDFAAVGRALGVSDDAAQKRVSRAVERLREFLAQRGVTVGASGLVVVISTNAVLMAPAGLSAAITTAALAGTAVATTTIAAATKTIAMTTLQKTLIAAALAAAIGTGIYEATQTARLRKELQTLQQQKAEQIQQAQRERDETATRLAAMTDENNRLKTASSELLRLRAEVTRLRAAEQDLDRLRASVSLPAHPPAASPAAEEIPKGSWLDSGFSSPQAALRTRGWAVLNDNLDRFADSVFITDAMRKAFEEQMKRMAEASSDPERTKVFLEQALQKKYAIEEGLLMRLKGENIGKEYTGYRILSQQSPSADEIIMEVETLMASAPARKEILKFHQFPNGWKVVIDLDSKPSPR